MDHRSHARNHINKIKPRREGNRHDGEVEEEHSIFMEFTRHLK